MEKTEIEKMVRDRLFTLQDTGYREFHSKLIPNVDKEAVIGVRTPALRKFAKEVAKTPMAAEFMKILPHRYYEENNLHGFLIEEIREYERCIRSLDVFLPYVDNWATCDLMAPKILKKHLPELLEQIRVWIGSAHTYTVRFGIGMLMRFYLEEAFVLEYADMVAAIRSEEYYVNMMAAWYFGTALAKQYEAVLPYIEEGRLPVWIHNKTIQKAVESSRIPKAHKEYLRSLRIK